MKEIMTILMFRLVGLASLAFASIGIAMAQPPVNVGVYAQHYGGKVVYHYRVVNNSSYDISAVWIGYDSKNDNDNYNDVWELLELPVGWNFDTGIPPASATSPPGWRVYVITLEESELLGIAWEAIDSNSSDMLAGQTMAGMSVTLDKADANYLTAHADVNFSNKPQYPTRLTVPIERLDTTPPSLTVNLSSSTLWPPNGKLVPITASITVRDDYDPQPEIKLQSISVSEVYETGDIRDAALGTDDRQFQLKAEQEGRNPLGRVYIVAYTATDGSGNQSLATATVTVPREQNQKDHAEKDRGDKKENERKDGKSDKDAEHHASEKKPFWKFW